MGLVMNQTVTLDWQPNPEWQIVRKEVRIQCQAACPFAAFCLRIDLPSPRIRGKKSPKVQFIERWHSRMDMSDNAIYLFTFRYAKTSIFENDDVADLVSEKNIELPLALHWHYVILISEESSINPNGKCSVVNDIVCFSSIILDLFACLTHIRWIKIRFQELILYIILLHFWPFERKGVGHCLNCS